MAARLSPPPTGPGGGGESRAAIGLRYPPAPGLQHAADNVVLAVAVEVADFDVDPGHRGAPGVPGGGGEGGTAIGNRHPPAPGLLDAAGNIGLAVAVKVADLDGAPGDARGPAAPHRRVERRAGGQAHPPITGALHPAGE